MRHYKFQIFTLKDNRIIFSVLTIILFFFTNLPQANSKVYFLEADYYQDKTQIKKIVVGKGEVISSDKPISRVAVSDPNIADIQVLNEKQLFLRAKQLGNTTVLAWEKDKSTPSRFDVSIWPDISNLTVHLQELDKNITVEYIPPNTTSSSSSSSSSQPGGEGAAPESSSPAAGLAALLGSGSAPPQASSSSSSSTTTVGKIILKGEVANAEVIARALQIAGAYIGDQGIKIISQPGGQVVDGLSGNYDLDSNSDAQSGGSSQGSTTSFGVRDSIKFTSNKFANLSRGVIATTQSGSVLSFLTVKDPPQISVAIRFYEIKRDLARNIGFNATFGGSTLQGGTFLGGNGISSPNGGIGSIANLDSFMTSQGSSPEFTFAHGSIAGGSFLSQTLGQGITGILFNPDNGIGAVIQALQERGEIKTLAEPNLVIANGEPASFLAGGEVPIVRSVFTAGGASQDITYEPFGIRFTLLPTVTSQNMIYLQLSPEIRDIDTNLSNLIAPPGSNSLRPPAFRTRRTQTQVELDSGQAFAISGLLREDNTRSLRKVPGIGDIPILGSLFRSKSFSKGETELLIVVSPQIIRPIKANEVAKSLSKPGVPYHDFDQFAPLKPYIKLDDEKGPEIKDPIDPLKYNRPQNSGDNPNASFNILPKKDDFEKQKKNLQAKFKKEFHLFNKKKEEKQNLLMEELAQARYREQLREEWVKEATNYRKAKEAMKLARENKYIN